MDYPSKRRIKIWGRARVVNDPDLMHELAMPDYDGVPEQAILFDVTAWDVNCPQHISPRYTEAEVEEITGPLKLRIEQLEQHLQSATNANEGA
jgi:predicted pyridoxine 5'-phosphate oxidase superfamily flavin-nucleotide-binding protein